MGMSRKVQMRKMWREGQRRSPRIFALGVWKAQATRPSVKRQRKCGSTAATATATASVNVHVIDPRKEQKPEGPATRTRAKKKRKVKQLHDVASAIPNSQQDSKSSDVQDGRRGSHEHHPINITDQPSVQDNNSQKSEDEAIHTDQPSSMPCSSWMPEKRILELIIDILQRRDTHEIFAEPVDPNEVEDYYEIINEPMDFGTMRAKLHEGMYKSLEHFEHDVFLISRNAMHFNSSSTIYFRQARAINELAKKVFHVLKTDPQNFELEFVRRRSGRRTQSEARSSTYGFSPKLTTNSKSSTMTFNAWPRTVPSSTSDSFNLGRATRANASCLTLSTTSYYSARDHKIHFSGDGKKPSSSEVDRRSTYKPWMSFLNKNSIFSTSYSNSKLLMHVNQQDIGYCKSLMMFVKDLGPTVQKIAKGKLSGWSVDDANFLTPGSNCLPSARRRQNSMASPSFHWPSTTLDIAITNNPQNFCGIDNVDMCNADQREGSYASNKMGAFGTSLKVLENSNDNSTFHGIRREAHSNDRMDILGVAGNKQHLQNLYSGILAGSHSSISADGDLKLLVSGLNNTSNKSSSLKLEKSQVDNKLGPLDSAFDNSETKCRLSDNYSFPTSSWPLQTIGMSSFDRTVGSMRYLSSPSLSNGAQAIAAQGSMYGLGDSSEIGQTLKLSEPPGMTVSQFIFDLPFLKTRLDQINASGRDRFLQQGSGRLQGAFLDRTNEIDNDDILRPSSDIQHSNLALQL